MYNNFPDGKTFHVQAMLRRHKGFCVSHHRNKNTCFESFGFHQFLLWARSLADGLECFYIFQMRA